MHRSRVRRATQGDQKAQGQNRTHRFFSNRPRCPCLGKAQAAPSQQIAASRLVTSVASRDRVALRQRRGERLRLLRRCRPPQPAQRNAAVSRAAARGLGRVLRSRSGKPWEFQVEKEAPFSAGQSNPTQARGAVRRDPKNAFDRQRHPLSLLRVVVSVGERSTVVPLSGFRGSQALEQCGNPMQSAHDAPRCKAKSKRAGKPCRAPAVRGCRGCRMHGAEVARRPASATGIIGMPRAPKRRSMQ